MDQTLDTERKKVIKDLNFFLDNINNEQFKTLSERTQLIVILNCLDKKDMTVYKDVPDIYNKAFGTQTKDEVELLNNFIATIQQNKDNIQQIINDHMKSIYDSKEELEKNLHSIQNSVFQRATNEIKVRVIISNLDEEERKNFANIPDIYNKEFGTQTKDEVELLKNFTITIQTNKNLQKIIDDHIKAVNANKEQIKTILQETIDTNENLKNLKRREKIMKIVESLEEEDRKKFKDIPNIFTKQTEKITKDELDSLASFIVQINQQEVKTKILNKVKNITKNDADTQSLDKIKTLISGNEFLKTLFRTSNQKDIDDLTVNDIYNCKNNFLLFTITLNEQQLKNTNIMPCISQINSLKNLNDYYDFLQTILMVEVHERNDLKGNKELSTKLENYFSIDNPLSKQNNLTQEHNKKIADIQSLIDNHMKAVNNAKEVLKASLNKINNKQFTNLNDCDKIICILNSLKEEERKKFKEIPSIFRQEWYRTTVEEVELLKEFTEAHIDNKSPWFSLCDCDCNCLKNLFG